MEAPAAETISTKVSIISKDTLVPLGFIIILVGGIVWLTTLYNDVQVTRQEVSELKSQVVENSVSIEAVTRKNLIVDEKLQTILEKLEDLKKSLALLDSRVTPIKR